MTCLQKISCQNSYSFWQRAVIGWEFWVLLLEERKERTTRKVHWVCSQGFSTRTKRSVLALGLFSNVPCADVNHALYSRKTVFSLWSFLYGLSSMVFPLWSSLYGLGQFPEFEFPSLAVTPQLFVWKKPWLKTRKRGKKVKKNFRHTWRYAERVPLVLPSTPWITKTNNFVNLKFTHNHTPSRKRTQWKQSFLGRLAEICTVDTCRSMTFTMCVHRSSYHAGS